MASIQHETMTRAVLRDYPGTERSEGLLRALEHEVKVRELLPLKAERLVKVWEGLEAEHRELWSDRDRWAREGVEGKLRALTREIKADPALECELKGLKIGHSRGLRLGRVLEEPNLKRALSFSIDRGRKRDYRLHL